MNELVTVIGFLTLIIVPSIILVFGMFRLLEYIDNKLPEILVHLIILFGLIGGVGGLITLINWAVLE